MHFLLHCNNLCYYYFTILLFHTPAAASWFWNTPVLVHLMYRIKTSKLNRDFVWTVEANQNSWQSTNVGNFCEWCDNDAIYCWGVRTHASCERKVLLVAEERWRERGCRGGDGDSHGLLLTGMQLLHCWHANRGLGAPRMKGRRWGERIRGGRERLSGADSSVTSGIAGMWNALIEHKEMWRDGGDVRPAVGGKKKHESIGWFSKHQQEM